VVASADVVSQGTRRAWAAPGRDGSVPDGRGLPGPAGADPAGADPPSWLTEPDPPKRPALPRFRH